MLTLSRKSLLALEAVVDVALHARPDPVQAREITKRQGVPQRYLEQVMQRWCAPISCAGCADPEAATGWRVSAAASASRKSLPLLRRLKARKRRSILTRPWASRLSRRYAAGYSAIDTEMDGITIADLCTGIDQPDQETDNFTI